MLAAREINSIKDESTPPIELWNNIGAKMDDFYANSHIPDESRSNHAARLLKERYEFMRAHGLIDEKDETNIITDDSPDFTEWLQSEIQHKIKTGQIYRDHEVMSVCDSCDMALSVQTGAQTSLTCHTCHDNNQHTSKRVAWFLNIDREPPNILLPRKARHLASHATNISERTWVERNRQYGTSLDFIGSTYKLDPKLGLSLMPQYVADLYNKHNLVIIQGKDTLYNIAPYVQTLSPELNTGYILPPNIPKDMDMQRVNALGVDFIKRYLPLFAIDRTTDVTHSQLVDLKREYDNAISYVNKMRQSTPPDLNDSTLNRLQDELTQAMDLFERCRIRDSIVRFRQTVVRTVATHGLSDQCKTKDPIIDVARERVTQIYGQI